MGEILSLLSWFWELFTAIWQDVFLVLHLQWFVSGFWFLWCMKRTNESPFSCNILLIEVTFQNLNYWYNTLSPFVVSGVFFYLPFPNYIFFQVLYVFHCPASFSVRENDNVCVFSYLAAHVIYQSLFSFFVWKINICILDNYYWKWKL